MADGASLESSGVEQPLQVFVSSRIEELIAERQSARHAIAGLAITRPWVFESTPAAAVPLDESYLEKVRTCDFFVLLVGEDASAPVEKELETALATRRPILAFLRSEALGRPRSADAQKLVARIPTKWAPFNDSTDLAVKIRVALIDEVIRRVRASELALDQAQHDQLDRARMVLTQAVDALPPRRYTHLVGREEETTKLLGELRRQGAGAPPVIAITGLGGIGKTALAHEVIERAIIEDLFAGLAWTSAKPEELETTTVRSLHPPALSYESLLDAIACQLDGNDLTSLPPRELETRLREVLRTKPHLIVVDNLETVEAYRSLAARLHDLLSTGLPGLPSRALLTSRERLADIPQIFDYYLKGLSQPSSHAFLRQEARDRGASGLVDAEQELLDSIYGVTQGMPLAMKLVVSQYLLGIPVDAELERLIGARETELYRFLYMRLWSHISIPAQKVLIAAASVPSPVEGIELKRGSVIESDDEFSDAIAELARMSLIEPSEHPTEGQRRYGIHQMTRWFIHGPFRDLWKRQRARAQQE